MASMCPLDQKLAHLTPFPHIRGSTSLFNGFPQAREGQLRNSPRWSLHHSPRTDGSEEQ